MVNHILQATLRSFATDVKYSSFKAEGPFPLEDGVLPDGLVHNSCIYKSKYDVAAYREKVPH